MFIWLRKHLGDEVEPAFTIPNLISLYRLFVSPVILIALLAGYREIFAVLLVISLVTDVLDGVIARMFNMQTKLGARLDSLADAATMVVGVLGVFAFELSTVKPDLNWFYLFLVCFALSNIIPVYRFGKLPGFHLYGFRASGYLLGANFIALFTIGYSSVFFIFSMIFASLGALEIVVVALILKEAKTDQRGLYWVLKNLRRSY